MSQFSVEIGTIKMLNHGRGAWLLLGEPLWDRKGGGPGRMAAFRRRKEKGGKPRGLPYCDHSVYLLPSPPFDVTALTNQLAISEGSSHSSVSHHHPPPQSSLGLRILLNTAFLAGFGNHLELVPKLEPSVLLIRGSDMNTYIRLRRSMGCLRHSSHDRICCICNRQTGRDGVALVLTPCGMRRDRIGSHHLYF